MAEPDWSLWRAFLAVIDTGSLSGAARRLRLAQPTLGRQVAALEAALGGEALFPRSPAGLRPTRAAEALAPHARAMAAAAEALLRTAAGSAEAMTGVVRLTASDVVGAELLPPILTRFRDAHPGIVLELVLSNRQEDLLRRDADIAVRMARPSQAALLARFIGVSPIFAYAHRRYLERHGRPDSVKALDDHALIGFDRAWPDLSGAESLSPAIDPNRFALRSDNDLAQLALLRAGAGIGFCQRAVAARDPDLVPLLAQRLTFSLETWVVMHEDLKGDPRLRALFDHLVEGLTAAIRPPVAAPRVELNRPGD